MTMIENLGIRTSCCLQRNWECLQVQAGIGDGSKKAVFLSIVLWNKREEVVFQKRKHLWQNWGTLIFLQTTGPLLVGSLHFHFQILPIKLPIIIKTCFAVKYTRKCFNEHKNGKCFWFVELTSIEFLHFRFRLIWYSSS